MSKEVVGQGTATKSREGEGMLQRNGKLDEGTILPHLDSRDSVLRGNSRPARIDTPEVARVKDYSLKNDDRYRALTKQGGELDQLARAAHIAANRRGGSQKNVQSLEHDLSDYNSWLSFRGWAGDRDALEAHLDNARFILKADARKEEDLQERLKAAQSLISEVEELSKRATELAAQGNQAAASALLSEIDKKLDVAVGKSADKNFVDKRAAQLFISRNQDLVQIQEKILEDNPLMKLRDDIQAGLDYVQSDEFLTRVGNVMLYLESVYDRGIEYLKSDEFKEKCARAFLAFDKFARDIFKDPKQAWQTFSEFCVESVKTARMAARFTWALVYGTAEILGVNNVLRGFRDIGKGIWNLNWAETRDAMGRTWGASKDMFGISDIQKALAAGQEGDLSGGIGHLFSGVLKITGWGSIGVRAAAQIGVRRGTMLLAKEGGEVLGRQAVKTAVSTLKEGVLKTTMQTAARKGVVSTCKSVGRQLFRENLLRNAVATAKRAPDAILRAGKRLLGFGKNSTEALTKTAAKSWELNRFSITRKLATIRNCYGRAAQSVLKKIPLKKYINESADLVWNGRKKNIVKRLMLEGVEKAQARRMAGAIIKCRRWGGAYGRALRRGFREGVAGELTESILKPFGERYARLLQRPLGKVFDRHGVACQSKNAVLSKIDDCIELGNKAVVKNVLNKIVDRAIKRAKRKSEKRWKPEGSIAVAALIEEKKKKKEAYQRPVGTEKRAPIEEAQARKKKSEDTMLSDKSNNQRLRDIEEAAARRRQNLNESLAQLAHDGRSAKKESKLLV